MTEFTPTTAQVRAAYSYDPTYEYLNPIGAEARRKEAEREFDRWLESVKAEAWDEGHSAGHEDYVGNDGTWPATPNPHRTRKTAARAEKAK